MNNFLALLSIPVFIAFCGFALLANENANATGQYAQADQFLSSIVK